MNAMTGVKSCDPFQLIELLRQSGKVTEARLDAALEGVELSAAKWSLLRHLAESDEPMALGQLAIKLACARSNVTQLTDRLEADGLVCRAPDPEDRRSVRAALTAAGHERYEAGLEVVREFERQLTADFLPEERELLQRLLSRLAEPERVQV